MLIDSIKEAFKLSKGWFFGSISTSAATLLLLKKEAELSYPESVCYGIVAFLAVILIRAIVIHQNKIFDKIKTLSGQVASLESNNSHLAAQREQLQLRANALSKEIEEHSKLIDKYNYGVAIILLAEVFSKFHSLRKRELEKEALTTTLDFMCNSVKKIFESRWKDKGNDNYQYSVCVKLFSIQEGEKVSMAARVITLCRDGISLKSRQGYTEGTHLVEDNTCFWKIYKDIKTQKPTFYINNNLPTDLNYENSSLELYKESNPGKNWKLPYESELVVPITPTEDSHDKRLEFLGYLCVDCNQVNAFNVKVDPGMLQGVADGIFDLVKRGVKDGILGVVRS